LHFIYQIELEVKDITGTQKSASYLELHNNNDNGVYISQLIRYSRAILFQTQHKMETP